MIVEFTDEDHVVVPKDLGKKLGLEAGDAVEISVEDGRAFLEAVKPKKETKYENWVEALLACPYPFEVPERSKDLPREIDLS